MLFLFIVFQAARPVIKTCKNNSEIDTQKRHLGTYSSWQSYRQMRINADEMIKIFLSADTDSRSF